MQVDRLGVSVKIRTMMRTDYIVCDPPLRSNKKLSMEGITIVLPVNQCDIYIHVYTHLMIMSLRLVGVTTTTIGWHANSCK
jgi:hypothetical protein